MKIRSFLLAMVLCTLGSHTCVMNQPEYPLESHGSGRMSVECQSTIEKLAQVLANRFSKLSRGWEASTPGERQEDLENILAARNVAAKLQDLVTESEAAALLALDDPLKAVADQWLELTGLDRPQDEALIRCVRILCGDTPRRDTQKASKKLKAHRRSPITR